MRTNRSLLMLVNVAMALACGRSAVPKQALPPTTTEPRSTRVVQPTATPSPEELCNHLIKLARQAGALQSESDERSMCEDDWTALKQGRPDHYACAAPCITSKASLAMALDCRSGCSSNKPEPLTAAPLPTAIPTELTSTPVPELDTATASKLFLGRTEEAAAIAYPEYAEALRRTGRNEFERKEVLEKMSPSMPRKLSEAQAKYLSGYVKVTIPAQLQTYNFAEQYFPLMPNHDSGRPDEVTNADGLINRDLHRFKQIYFNGILAKVVLNDSLFKWIWRMPLPEVDARIAKSHGDKWAVQIALRLTGKTHHLAKTQEVCVTDDRDDCLQGQVYAYRYCLDLDREGEPGPGHEEVFECKPWTLPR